VEGEERGPRKGEERLQEHVEGGDGEEEVLADEARAEDVGGAGLAGGGAGTLESIK
jgi:hypothetical protein